MMEHDGTWEEVPLSAWLVDEWFALQASMGSWPFKPRIFFLDVATTWRKHALRVDPWRKFVKCK
jgi:hypothetical protein